MKFTKMTACGNDYIYFEESEIKNKNVPLLCKKLCDVHKGIGGDGIVLIGTENPSMRIFNKDGSEAETCGNALRCVARYLFDKGFIGENAVINTKSGKKQVTVLPNGDISVNMGKWERFFTSFVFYQNCPIFINVGNNHAVVLSDDLSNENFNKITFAVLENSGEMNVELVKVENKKEITLRVMERGSGETMACGSGAVASVIACNILGVTDKEVTVCMKGGKVRVLFDEEALLIGEAKYVYSGETVDV